MNTFDESVAAIIGKSGVFAVLNIQNAEDAVPAAKTLVNSGITAMELVMRTEAAPEALRRIVREVPDMLAGVGTLLAPQQVEQVEAIGASYGVSPGMNPTVMAKAQALSFPFAPGIATPSEIESAVQFGCRLLKLFPAVPLGGVSYLKAMDAAYRHLNLQYMPLGGLSEENMVSWLEMPQILAIGGSWIAPSQLIADRNWDEIARRADRAIAMRDQVRG